MSRSTVQAASHLGIELLVLVAKSMLAGYTIGTAQHFVVFGVGSHGELFSVAAFKFAAIEGGLVGAIAGIPTGLVVYYGVLRRRLDFMSAAYIIGGSLVGGCIMGALIQFASVPMTPLLTIGISVLLRASRSRVRSRSQ